jgi:hypothetical protein
LTAHLEIAIWFVSVPQLRNTPELLAASS